MGPYGSVGAHIKTGKRSMAPDHFQTSPDPKKGYKNQKKSQKYPKKIQNMLRKYFPSTVRLAILFLLEDLCLESYWKHPCKSKRRGGAGQ